MNVVYSIRSNLGPNIRELSRLSGYPVMAVFRDEMRLAMEQAQRFTPPPARTKAITSQRTKSGFITKANVSIRKDLHNVAVDGSEKLTTIPTLQAAIRENRAYDVQQILNNLPNSHRWSKRAVIPVALARTLHRRSRDARGRVKTDRKNIILSGSDRAAWVNEVGARIGIAKSSFTPALDALNSRAGRATYIRRHGDRWGTYHETIAQANHFGEAKGSEIVIELKGMKMSEKDSKKIVDDAISKRAKSIETKIKRLIDGKAVNMGRAGGIL